jgi:hypothetical protein
VEVLSVLSLDKRVQCAAVGRTEMPMRREPLAGVLLRIVLCLEPPARDMFQFQTVAFLVYILDHQYIGTLSGMAP